MYHYPSFYTHLLELTPSTLSTDMTKITIAGLKPETAYEVKISAINGKGEGESSAASTFKTKPVRKYCPRSFCFLFSVSDLLTPPQQHPTTV